MKNKLSVFLTTFSLVLAAQTTLANSHANKVKEQLKDKVHTANGPTNTSSTKPTSESQSVNATGVPVKKDSDLKAEKVVAQVKSKVSQHKNLKK